MTKKAEATEVEVTEDAKATLSRDELRTALLSAVPKPDSKIITMFGVELELRQPNLGAIMKTREKANETTRAIDMIIEYSFVPGTNDHVFEATDHDMIKNWPFGPDLARLNAAIAELTGVDIEAAVEGLRHDPLED